MFAWYANAFCCVAYLADVPSKLDLDKTSRSYRSIMWDEALKSDLDERRMSFQSSAWFRRGWTLQELLAPHLIIFCDQTWAPFGWLTPGKEFHRNFPFPNVAEEVATASRIDEAYLGKGRRRVMSDDVSLAEKLSWAASRSTTRIEDEAYCLMGILNVNMPLLYGEGHKAFKRLQQELVKDSNDQSLFAWDLCGFPKNFCNSRLDYPRFDDTTTAMLAQSPRQFIDSGEVRIGRPCPPYDLTNRGLRLNAEYIVLDRASTPSSVLIRLNCFIEEEFWRDLREETDTSRHDIIMILTKHKEIDQWYRDSPDTPGLVTDPLSARLERHQRLRKLAAGGTWQPERTFFVDAF